MSLSSRLWSCAILMAINASALAQVDAAREAYRDRRVAATRAVTPPVLDGLLDDAVWKDAQVIRDFHQVDPEAFAAPAVATSAALNDRPQIVAFRHAASLKRRGHGPAWLNQRSTSSMSASSTV